MTKKHDELVEEIGREVYYPYWPGPLLKEYSDHHDRITRAITRILSAVGDGRLDIPGDIGELSVGALRDTTEDDLQFDFELWAWVRAMVKNGADVLIALCKEEGENERGTSNGGNKTLPAS